MRLPSRKYQAHVRRDGRKVAVSFWRGGKALKCPTCEQTVKVNGKTGNGTATLSCGCKKRAMPVAQMEAVMTRLEKGDLSDL